MRSGGTLSEFPLEPEKDGEKVVVPLGGTGRPRSFESARDRVATSTGSKTAGPANALLFDARSLGLAATVDVGVSRAVGLAEGVTTRDERDGLFVIHGHAAKGLAYVNGGGEGI